MKSNLRGRRCCRGPSRRQLLELRRSAVARHPDRFRAHHAQGSLTVAGNVTLDAARIYPLTATTFAIKAVDSGSGASTVAFGQTSANPGTPLSAGGALTVTADVIGEHRDD